MEWIEKKEDHIEKITVDDGKLVVNKIFDVEPTLNRNKTLQNDGSNGFSQERSFRHIGFIPNHIYEQWLNEEYNKCNDIKLAKETVSSDKFIKQKLRDNPFLKTCDGNI